MNVVSMRGLVVFTGMILLVVFSGLPALAQSVEAPQAIEDSVMIGMAKVDITPDPSARKVTMSGYSGRGRKAATGILDHVHARALVGTDPDGNLFGLVGLDMCYVPVDFREQVIAEVKDLGFTTTNLMLAATHTHSSIHIDRTPLSRILFGSYDQALFKETVAKVAGLIRTAHGVMQPAAWEYATVEIAGMNRSRLDPAFEIDEHQMAGAEEPDPENYPVNDDLTLLRFTDGAGQPIGAVVHFAAHPTVLSPDSMAISADFPGVLYPRLEEQMGEGSVAIYLNATLGDTAPTPDWEDDAAVEARQMKEYGNLLADKVLLAMEELEPLGDPKIAAGFAVHNVDQVTLRPLWGWTLPKFLSRLLLADPALPFQALRLGDLVLLGLPGEPTTKVGEIVKSSCPKGLQCRIVAPANGYAGYNVTPEEYEGGTYAADSCFLGPDAAQIMKDAMTKALAKVQ